ncbi:MAG: hypothetical protein IT373_01130 [Polyangiaceae bacterium]|nr:hypothetical protein [Polyangiaceae bacterium]
MSRRRGVGRLAAAVGLGLGVAGALGAGLGGTASVLAFDEPGPTAVRDGADAGPVVPAPAPPDAGGGGKVTASCVEVLPKGATRPGMTVSFPAQGLTGYEARLVVTLTHGGGETALPEGFRWERQSDAARALEDAGFMLPVEDGGSPPLLERVDEGEGAKTTLSVPFVPLPRLPGRHTLRLPSLPIKVARANKDVMTLCTPPQDITVEDPIANEDDPKVKPNPPGRSQREDWALARYVFFGVLIGVVVAAALALLARWLLRRPKTVVAPPKDLPWVAALKELAAIRGSELLAQGRSDELFDRVSDCVRKYLGERYGFDGLESTTAETRRLLKRVYPPLLEMDRIVRFLEDSDLVKFARLVPTHEDCDDALARAEHIVRSTTPASAVGPQTGGSGTSGAGAAPPRRAA